MTPTQKAAFLAGSGVSPEHLSWLLTSLIVSILLILIACILISLMHLIDEKSMTSKLAIIGYPLMLGVSMCCLIGFICVCST